jgi:hypothetical protein
VRTFALMSAIALAMAVTSVASAEPCAYSLCTRAKDGPEITGNYARPYLYSEATRCWYPDPMYYVAKDALRRWHSRHDRCAPDTSSRSYGRKAYATVEK